jgi:hypothetical protein
MSWRFTLVAFEPKYVLEQAGRPATRKRVERWTEGLEISRDQELPAPVDPLVG